MRPSYLLWALVLGLTGFAAIEMTQSQLGPRLAIPNLAINEHYPVVDAVIYSVSTVLVAALFARPFRRAGTWTLPVLVIAFVLTFAPVATVVAVTLELAVDLIDGTAVSALSTIKTTPMRLLGTLAIDAWFVTVPLGIASAALIAWLARRAGAPHRR